jgi:hypothetical protein
MSDIVERLRSPEKVVIPAGTEMTFIHSTSQWPHTLFPVMVCGGTGGTMRNLEPFSVAISSSDRLEAAIEIERLRARVEVLERVREAAQRTQDCWGIVFGNAVCLPLIAEQLDALRDALKEAQP